MLSYSNVSFDPITPDTTSGDRLLRAREAAEILACSTRTIWKLRSEGVLEAVAIGAAIRFRQSAVQGLVRHGAPNA